MAYYPTMTDLQYLYFSEKIWHVKVVLLNEKFQQIYEMKHEFISGNISTNVDSDIRNTLSLTLGVINKMVGIEEDKLLWINRYVKIYIGISVPCWGNEIKWYDKGIFVMTDYNYNAQTSTLSINCSDLVCMLNGDVGGSLEGLETIVFVDEINSETNEPFTISEVIKYVLTDLANIKNYYIERYNGRYEGEDFVYTYLGYDFKVEFYNTNFVITFIAR